MTLLDVLLTEQLVEIFRAAGDKRPEINAELLPGHDLAAEVPLGDRGAFIRIQGTGGEMLAVTARGIHRVVGDEVWDLADFEDLVGYDWIATEMDEKVAGKDEHYDRIFLHLNGERTVTLQGLGPSVYALMSFLGKVLEVRSQKVILRGLDDDVVDLLGRCLRAAVEGPFFGDDELDNLFALDRPNLAVLASMWTRMNLAAPDLRRTVVSVAEMVLERRGHHPDAWDEWVGAEPEQVRGALEVFSRVVQGEV